METEATTQIIEEQETEATAETDTQETIEEQAATTQVEEAGQGDDESPTIEDIVSGKKTTDKKGIDTTPKWFKSRLDEMTAKLYEKEARIKELENRTSVIDRPVLPLRDDFIDAEDFRKAMVGYEDTLDVWKTRHREVTTNQERQKQEFTEATSAFNERAEGMRKKYVDFDSVINEPVFSPAMSMEVMTSEYGPEIGYYLAKNPAEALKLSKLTPNLVAKEIGKLEVKFSQASKRIVSNAPKPITTVKGADAPEKDPSKMTDSEWYEWEKQQKLKKMKIT